MGLSAAAVRKRWVRGLRLCRHAIEHVSEAQ